MIDFHNHVLPDVDDGPKATKESLSMIRCASIQGITDIVQTVHFQHPKMHNKNVDYNFLKSKIDKLQIEINKNNLDIVLHLSAEVFYLPNLVEISENPLVTIGNKKYMLIEFATNIFPIGYENQFYNLQLNGITPIVAHPERYKFIQDDISILELWVNRGYVIQIDAGSIIGHFGKKTQKISIDMVKSGYIHLIGSDAHNNKKRNFCIKESYDLLHKYINISILKSNARQVLNGGPVSNSKFNIKNKTSSIASKLFKFLGNLW